MKNIKSFFKKIDNNLLLILTAFLVVFIPLYPKLPLADLIEGYIVRLRLEDIFIFLTFVIWLIQLVRKKVKLVKNKFSNFIIAYIIFGFLSCLSALFLTKTVPFIRSHVLKLFLHWVRRIEYFSLFFITYSAINSKKQLKLFLKMATGSLLGVVVYGFGQKYLYWPAFSTMNREFSKGVALYLRPHSRLMSTFAGQYDLAAYIMLALSLIIPSIWFTKKKLSKILLFFLFLLSYWTLILTASRASFLSYLGGITILSSFLIKDNGILWVLKKWIPIIVFSLLITFFFGDLTDRFIHLIPNKQIKEKIFAVQDVVSQPFKKRPEKEASTGNFAYVFGLFRRKSITSVPDGEVTSKGVTLPTVASKSDSPPTTVKPTEEIGEELPPDVTQDSEDYRKKQAEEKSEKETGSGYSKNALKYGLSVAIRLDALWPRAWASFKKNPLLGTGYSTLVKSQNTEFTYAESTDNDYLRMLGETGILGAFTFLALPFLILHLTITNLSKIKTKLTKIIFLGAIAATSGLLINALYIDIFESSKVAYTFWMLAALAYKSLEIERKNV